MTANTTSGLYPAVVRIIDLQTASFPLDSSVVFEAVQTSGGTTVSVQVPLTAIMTTVQGALPTGGGTGQILNKTNANNYSTQWSSITQFVGVGTGLVTSGSATSIVVSFAQQSALSVLGVAGNATLEPAAIVGAAAQVLRVNDAGNALAFGAINIASAAAVTGVLGVPSGGSNTSTLTSKGVLFGNGTATVGITAAGVTGTVLASPGSAASPSFVNIAGGGLSGGTLTNTTTLSALNVVNVAARVGPFDVWQRLNNTTTLSQAAQTTLYQNDGWYLVTGTSQAATLTQVTGIATGSLFAATVQRNSGQSGTTVMRYAAPLDSDELAMTLGNVVGISFTGQSGAGWSPASGTISLNVYSGTGSVGKRGATAYTGEVSVIGTSFNLTSTATRYSAIATAAVATNASQMEIQFSWTPATTAGANDSFTVDDLQLEVVASTTSVVSPFVRQDMQTQLARAQRFLPVMKSLGTSFAVGLGIGQVINATTAAVILPFHVPTRVRCNGFSISTATDFSLVTNTGANTTCVAFAFINGGLDNGWLQPSLATALLTTGQASQFFTQSANGFIMFTGAEI